VEITTTFHLRSHRVVHHVSIGRDWYERRRTYAFAEIAGLRLNGYSGEPLFLHAGYNAPEWRDAVAQHRKRQLSDLRNDNRGDLRSNRLAEARRRASTLALGKLSGVVTARTRQKVR
jgi:hypothetical protein